MNLIEAFDLQPRDLVALVGGGGKSSLLFALGRQWPGRAVLTTTTRLFQIQTALAAATLRLADNDRLDEVLAAAGSCLVVGETAGDKVLGVPADLPARWLDRPAIDLVVVEADGSRQRPVKAPAAHEPVLPTGTTRLIVVAGLDALEAPIKEAAHRPELVCRLLDLRPEDRLTPAALAALLVHPEGGLKGRPPAARVAVCLNKVEGAARRARADETAARLLAHPAVERVVLTTRQAGEPPVVRLRSGSDPPA